MRLRRQSELRTKAEQYYSDILRQVLPAQRLYLPTLSQVSELSCFRDLLDPDRETQPAEWEHAADQLSGSLSDWMTRKKEHHISLLPCQSALIKTMEVTLLSNPSIDRWRHEAMLDFAGQLDLATSVFRQPGTDMVLIGRDACHAWKLEGQLSCPEDDAKRYSWKACVCHLLSLLSGFTKEELVTGGAFYCRDRSCLPSVASCEHRCDGTGIHLAQ